jgi:hypothetical protein
LSRDKRVIIEITGFNKTFSICPILLGKTREEKVGERGKGKGERAIDA